MNVEKYYNFLFHVLKANIPSFYHLFKQEFNELLLLKIDIKNDKI